jgi:hypothetical protein
MIASAIEHCLKDIRLNIPYEILTEAFKHEYKERNKSLDGIIKEKIIVDIVLRKTNLYSGKLKKIELLGEWAITTRSPNIVGVGLGYNVYAIPPAFRENRDITSVISLSYPLGLFEDNYLQPNTYDSLYNKTNELFENTFGTGQSFPIPTLVEDNIIKLHPPQTQHVNWLLTCMLAYDSNFTNISPNMIEPLSELCIYATQMYIYNKLKIPINSAIIHSGSEIGSFNDIIDSYSDAKEKFNEMLMQFRGAATFDQENILSILNLMNI